MLSIKIGKIQWLWKYGEPELIEICKNRIEKAMYDWVLRNKYSTKNLGGDFWRAPLKVIRVLINNLKRNLPFLRDQTSLYVVPFIKVNPRSREVWIALKTYREIPIIIDRYFRYIKVYSTLNELRVPLSLTVRPFTQLYPNSDGGAYVRVDTLRISAILTWPSWSQSSFTIIPLIIKLPQILKIIATLHRKAHFIDESINPTNSATATSP